MKPTFAILVLFALRFRFGGPTLAAPERGEGASADGQAEIGDALNVKSSAGAWPAQT